MMIEVTAQCSRAAKKYKVGRGRKGDEKELLFDMVCLPFGIGFVLKLLDCVIISAYTTPNICTITEVLREFASMRCQYIFPKQ